MSWLPLLLTVVGCFALKLAGTLVPDRALRDVRVASMAALIPVALLAAITALATVTSGQRYALDARVAGLVVAGLAIMCRAPFVVVVLSAAGTAALIRALAA